MRKLRRERGSTGDKPPGRFGTVRALLVFAALWIMFAIGVSTLKQQTADGGDEGGENTNTTFFPADGRSQLPGARASLRYNALPGQREKVNVGYKSTGRPAWSGTMWALITPDERSFITIFEQRFEPTLSPEMMPGALGAYNSDIARTTGSPTAYRTRRIDGREAWVWRYLNDEGGRELQAWVVNQQYGHRLHCRVANDEPEVWRQCQDALKKLKFST